MIKKLLFSMILIFGCGAAQAVNHVDDEQKQVVKKLMKKVLRAQSSGKSNQFILDEIVTEVAAEFDDSGELISDKKSDTILIAGGIVLGGLALSIGGYLWYKHYRTQQQQNAYVESPEDDVVVEPMPITENPVIVQPEQEIPVPVPLPPVRQYAPFSREVRPQLHPLMHQLVLNEFFGRFPRDVQAPLREAIRNGADQNLINFTDALVNMGQRPWDRMAEQRFRNLVEPAIERLTHYQQLSILVNPL